MTGETDLAEANRLQDATHTLPLSAWNDGRRESLRKMPSKPIPTYRDAIAFGAGTTGEDQRNPEFFSVLRDALRLNPPYAWWDRKFVDTHLEVLGVLGEEGFEFNRLDESTQKMILDAQASAFDKIMKLSGGGFGPMVNGWQFGPDYHGDWRDHLLQRAYGIYIGGMWPVPANSTYALVHVDANDQLMTGDKLYSLEFKPGQLPPATSFWSVTLYETGTFDLYPNEEQIYVVGSLHDSTVYAEDGSLRILFSHERPAGSDGANWIPAPEGKFWLAIRFYAPTESVLRRDYVIPPVRQLH